jgi:hypothetical protein
MKELKKVYRAAFNKLKSTKGECSKIQQAVDHAKESLVNSFEMWYEDTFEEVEGM